jgi:hypothetical protein
MRRFTVLLAAAIPLAATIGLAAVAAGPATTAQAATICSGNPDTQIGDFASNVGQWWYTASSDAGTNAKVWAYAGDSASYWCQVPSGQYPGYVLYRYQGTSDCATFDAGPTGGPTGDAQGEGTTDLQPCEDTVQAQNWLQEGLPNGDTGLTTYYNTAGTCLSSKEAGADSDTEEPLVMVGPTCSGDGGQSWTFDYVTATTGHTN